jgi:chromodomain-helicase-DNA-binding protein 7
MIYRLVTRNTYEAEMFNRASKKLGLDQAVLSNMVKGGMQEEDKKDLDRLLKLGAYGLLDEDDSAARKFEESNIDEILAHGTRVIKHSENKGGESGGLGAISFSKMSFASAGADVTIDINDPDFWEKVLAGKDRSVDQVNVEDLSFELVDGTATKSVKSRKEWFERLKKKVRQTFVAKQNGHSVSDLHDLIALLKTFMSNPKFAADDKKLAQAWIKDLGRRGGKRSSANEAQYDDDDSRSESSSDDEVVGADADEYEGSDHEATQTKKGRLLVPKGELCFSCFKRGQLMYCDGPCSQPYHPACVEREDDVPPTTEAWLCPKCDISEQLCLICSEPGIIDDPEGVLRCSSPGCPSFFHISCAQEHHLTSWFRGEQKFRCPRHFCVICEKGPGTGVGSLISCVFCVNSYHLQCFPSKQEYVRLNNKWIICPSCQNDRAEDPLIQSAMKGAEESVEIGIVRKRGKPVFKKPDKDKKSKRVKKLVSGSYRVKFYDEGELIHELDGVPINNSVSPKSMPKKGKKASAANEGDELDQSSLVSEPDEEQSSQASSEDASGESSVLGGI